MLPPPSQHWISKRYTTAESLTPHRAILLQAHHASVQGDAWFILMEWKWVWIVTLCLWLAQPGGHCWWFQRLRECAINAAVAWWWGLDLHCIALKAGRQAGRKGGREEDEASETLERKPRELEAGQELGNRQPPSLSLSRLRHHCCSLRAASHYHMAVQVQRPWDWLSGHTLLRVQRNGLKINSQ